MYDVIQQYDAAFIVVPPFLLPQQVLLLVSFGIVFFPFSLKWKPQLRYHRVSYM